MSSDRRGRGLAYDDSDYSDYDNYEDERYARDKRPPPPRHRSLSRLKSMGIGLADKLERGLGFGRDSPSPVGRSPRRGGRARSVGYEDDDEDDEYEVVKREYHRRPRSRGGDGRLVTRRRESDDDYYRHSRPASRGRRVIRRGSRSSSSSYSRSPSPRRRRPRSVATNKTRDKSQRRWSHAAVAGLDTAVVEALRVRGEPGSWAGGKGARVATAALGAAAVDAIIDRNPEHHRKRKTVESTLGGLLLNRMVNGPRRDLRR